MEILVDENNPRMTVAALCELGHDVKDVRGTGVQGIGFTEYRGRAHYGILVVRLRQPNRQKIHDRVMLAMRKLKSWEWRGALVVMRDRTMSTSRSAGTSAEG